MADPATQAAIIAAVVTALANIIPALSGGKTTQINQEAAPVVGGAPTQGVLPGLPGLADPLGGLNTEAPLGDIATLLDVLGGPEALSPVVQAGAAAEQAKTAAETAVGNVGEVSTEVAGTTKQEKGAKKKVAPAKKGPSIGDILAAIPDALLAVNAFGGPEGVSTQRAAPPVGSAQGGLVGQFRPPPPLDIGRLLASLPGIRA